MTDTPPSVPYVPGQTGAMPAQSFPPMVPPPSQTGALPAQGFPPMVPPPGRPPVPGPNPGGNGGRAILFGVIGLVAGLAVGGCIGAAAASGTKNNPALTAEAAKPAATTVYITVTADAPTTAAKPTPAATTSPPPPPPPAVPTIEDGTWTIGEDMPAGTYKATGAGDTCYWAIYKSGTNQSFDSIVDNHLGGGNLRVTVKAGQDFETKRCGTWTKVG